MHATSCRWGSGLWKIKGRGRNPEGSSHGHDCVGISVR